MGGGLTKNQYREGNCLKREQFADLRRGGCWGLDTPMHTMHLSSMSREPCQPNYKIFKIINP